MNLEKLFLEYELELHKLHLMTSHLAQKYHSLIDDEKMKTLNDDLENRQRLINIIEQKYQVIVNSIQNWHKKQIKINDGIKAIESDLMNNLRQNKEHYKKQLHIEQKFSQRG